MDDVLYSAKISRVEKIRMSSVERSRKNGTSISESQWVSCLTNTDYSYANFEGIKWWMETAAQHGPMLLLVHAMEGWVRT